MKKRKGNPIKEICIIMLLTVLIILILAVTLYDIIPNDIAIPETIEYNADSKTTSIKQEIAYTNGGDSSADESVSESELVTALKSYSIDAEDLNVYGQKNLYNSGNSNPFDYAPEETTTTSTSTDGTTTTTTTTTTSSGQTETQNANSTTGTFFEKPSSK